MILNSTLANTIHDSFNCYLNNEEQSYRKGTRKILQSFIAKVKFFKVKKKKKRRKEEDGRKIEG